MIKNIESWNAWESEWKRHEPVDVGRNLRVMDAMYEEARSLGRLSSPDPLEGLERDISYAKAINVRISSGPHRTGA